MKSISLLFALISVGFFSLNAQEALIIEEASYKFLQDDMKGFGVEVPQINVADLSKHWEKYIKKNAKTKVSSSDNQWSFSEGSIQTVSSIPINSHAHFLNSNNKAKIEATFSYSDTATIHSADYPNESSLLKKFMFNFAKEAYILEVENEFKVAESALKQLEKELESMHSEEDQKIKEIAQSESDIKAYEQEVSAKEQEQELIQSQILDQKKAMLKGDVSPEQEKLQEKVLKDLEKEKASLIKAQNSLHKKIANSKHNIIHINREIDNVKTDQQVKQTEISKQKEVISAIGTKLSAIQTM